MAEKMIESHDFKLGDRVQIINYSGPPGKIVELRGPLGQRGMNLYRVAIPQKPDDILIEVRGNQLELLPPRRRKSPPIGRRVLNPLRKRAKGGLGTPT